MNTKTKKKNIAAIGLVSALIATCIIVLVAAQPTPFMISGYIVDTENNPVNNSIVTVTNINTGEVFTAKTNESSNYYQLVLANSSDVNESDKLRIIAKKVTEDDSNNYHPNGSTYIINVSQHNVTLDNITAGGVFNVNLTLGEFCIHYDYPYEVNNQSNYSGAAVMKMWANFKNVAGYNQTQLQAMGRANNSNLSRPYYVDPMGMANTLKGIIPLPSGHTFTVGVMPGTPDGLNWAMHRICWWQWTGPGALPTYGYYANWMAVRGIHTDKDPHRSPGGGFYSYNVSGFWINDPNSTVSGIGENSYKTAAEWNATYYKVISDPLYYPYYDGKYITVLEPPEHDADVRIVPVKPRLIDAITPELMTKPLMVYGVEQLALEKVVKDDELLKIVKAAIDGVTDELVPYDAEFAVVFAKTVPGEPMLVTSDNEDYYIVPFNVPVEVKSIKKVPVAIERPKVSGLKKLERVKRMDANAVIEPIAIEPIKVERTLVVVRVDAVDGSFKEVSWVADPVKYLPVSKREALKLALGEVQIASASELSNLQSTPTIELVHRDASPYYPDWKVTIGDDVFYVGQDGTVSS